MMRARTDSLDTSRFGEKARRMGMARISGWKARTCWLGRNPAASARMASGHRQYPRQQTANWLKILQRLRNLRATPLNKPFVSLHLCTARVVLRTLLYPPGYRMGADRCSTTPNAAMPG